MVLTDCCYVGTEQICIMVLILCYSLRVTVLENLEALDQVISSSVLEEVNRLLESKQEHEQYRLLSEAKLEIFKLQELTIPDYANELVAAAYVIAYQVQHINLTYSLLRPLLVHKAREGKIASDSRLHIVDFGAGAMATQLGLALAVSDGLRDGLEFGSIHVDSMDTSEAMLLLGMEIWSTLESLVSEGASEDLTPLREALSLISFEPHMTVDTIKPIEGCEVWLSSIHAIYQQNEQFVKRDLATLHRRLHPKIGIITCYGNHDAQDRSDNGLPLGNVEIVRRVTPFQLDRYLLYALAGNDKNIGNVGSQSLKPLLPLSLPLGILWPRVHIKRVTELNEKLGLINSNGTRRTENSIHNWTWDTASFVYIRSI